MRCRRALPPVKQLRKEVQARPDEQQQQPVLLATCPRSLPAIIKPHCALYPSLSPLPLPTLNLKHHASQPATSPSLLDDMPSSRSFHALYSNANLVHPLLTIDCCSFFLGARVCVCSFRSKKRRRRMRRRRRRGTGYDSLPSSPCLLRQHRGKNARPKKERGKCNSKLSQRRDSKAADKSSSTIRMEREQERGRKVSRSYCVRSFRPHHLR